MLELDRVGFGYNPQEWVFRDVSFTVAPGSATAVLGPNGSGKTTLVRCAAGLLAPLEGAVHRDQNAGYVPQAHGSAFAYRAVDMVLMGRARHVGVFRAPGRADRAAAMDALERVGATDLQDRLFPTLSGGEQQLVLIARAIAAGSPLLVLDEPATGLDLKNQARVLTLLRELMANGMAMLVSTHHPEHAMHLAEHVVLLGRSGARTGSAAELLTDSELSALYGVHVTTLSYSDDGAHRTAIVVDYGPDVSDRSAGRPHK